MDYELLNDTPAEKAGMKFKWNEYTDRYEGKNDFGVIRWYKKEHVEDNPAWFARIGDFEFVTSDMENNFPRGGAKTLQKKSGERFSRDEIAAINRVINNIPSHQHLLEFLLWEKTNKKRNAGKTDGEITEAYMIDYLGKFIWKEYLVWYSKGKF